MKAVILDMYGVILKETGDGYVPYIQRTFPTLSSIEIYEPWDMANIGELSSVEIFGRLGFKGDLVQIQKEYLDTIEINDDFYEFASEIKRHFKLALISNDASEWSSYLCEKYSLNEYFDAISVSGDLKEKSLMKEYSQLRLQI
jgi:putative hydrolase of the HAD superfamily